MGVAPLYGRVAVGGGTSNSHNTNWPVKYISINSNNIVTMINMYNIHMNCLKHRKRLQKYIFLNDNMNQSTKTHKVSVFTKTHIYCNNEYYLFIILI